MIALTNYFDRNGFDNVGFDVGFVTVVVVVAPQRSHPRRILMEHAHLQVFPIRVPVARQYESEQPLVLVVARPYEATQPVEVLVFRPGQGNYWLRKLVKVKVRDDIEDYLLYAAVLNFID